MKHLLDIKQLSKDDINQLIRRALNFKHTKSYPQYPNKIIAHLFYEDSTRTRVSFEVAAKKLGIAVINVDLAHSSEQKGETIEDTLRTLIAIGVDLFVIRHKTNNMPQHLASICPPGVVIINAGDGTNAHPSQALLDLMTIMEYHKNLSTLKLVVVGHISHSRVANSIQSICKNLNVGELVLVAPEPWKPQEITYGRFTSSLEDGMAYADVVMVLRVQRERIEKDLYDINTYKQQYLLTTERLALANKGAYVLHPGPVNRGIEIESSVVDGAQSLILQQVHNGVFMRMAILEAALSF